jgi:PhnB protein
MASANVYLTFNGNCEAAFNFYKSVFGGEFNYISRFNEMPRVEGLKPMSEEDGDKIMHISLPLSKETSLMGSDTGGEWASGFIQGNNFAISLNTESKSEADHLFNSLAAGGKVTMPMNMTFWNSYFGMLTDKFGIGWMISFDNQPQQ